MQNQWHTWRWTSTTEKEGIDTFRLVCWWHEILCNTCKCYALPFVLLVHISPLCFWLHRKVSSASVVVGILSDISFPNPRRILRLISLPFIHHFPGGIQKRKRRSLFFMRMFAQRMLVRVQRWNWRAHYKNFGRQRKCADKNFFSERRAYNWMRKDGKWRLIEEGSKIFTVKRKDILKVGNVVNTRSFWVAVN